MIALSDLTKEVTVDEAKATLYAVCVALGLPITGWLSGAVVRTLIAVVAVVVAGISRLIARIARGGFRSLAENEWLTLLAKDQYGLDRIGAEYASGTVRLTKTGGAVYSLEPGDLILKHASKTTLYSNRDAISLAGAATVDAVFVAMVAGSASDAAIGEITQFVTPLNGVASSNTTAFQGQDRESDAELRARCAAQFASMSAAGPADVYVVKAKASRLNGAMIGVNRVLVQSFSPGSIKVLCAKNDGEITAPEEAQVTADLQTITPLGVTSYAVTATAMPTNIRYTAYAYQGSQTEADIKSKIYSALAAWLQTRPIGGDNGCLWVSAIHAVILGADPSIYRVALTLPAADIWMNPTWVATVGDFTTGSSVVLT